MIESHSEKKRLQYNLQVNFRYFGKYRVTKVELAIRWRLTFLDRLVKFQPISKQIVAFF